MESIRAADDYTIWLQGVFDSIGDRLPSEAEWTMIRERHALMAGEVVLQKMEKREYEAQLQREKDKINAQLASYYGQSQSQYQKAMQQLNSIALQGKVTNQLTGAAIGAGQSQMNFNWPSQGDEEEA